MYLDYYYLVRWSYRSVIFRKSNLMKNNVNELSNNKFWSLELYFKILSKLKLLVRLTLFTAGWQSHQKFNFTLLEDLGAFYIDEHIEKSFDEKNQGRTRWRNCRLSTKPPEYQLGWGCFGFKQAAGCHKTLFSFYVVKILLL